MRPYPQKGWFSLGCAEQFEQTASENRVLPFAAQARNPPDESLDREGSFDPKAGRSDLLRELARVGEKCSRPVSRYLFRIPMSPTSEVPLYDSNKLRVREVACPTSVQHRGEAANADTDENPPGPQDPVGFPECGTTIRRAWEVIQGTHEQKRVGRRIGKPQVPSVPEQDFGRCRARVLSGNLSRLTNVKRDGIHEVDLVSEPS